MIKLGVKDLKQERGRLEHYDVSVEMSELDGVDGKIPFAGPVNIEIDLTNTGIGILAHGRISTAVKLDCARCLNSFKHDILTDFVETYYDKEKGVPDQAGDVEEYIPFLGDEIDVQPEVIKAILLAIPIRGLCDPTCRGLCSVCGCNLNNETCNCDHDKVDLRLAKLKQLLE